MQATLKLCNVVVKHAYMFCFIIIFFDVVQAHINIYVYIHRFFLGSGSNSKVLECCEKYIQTYLYIYVVDCLLLNKIKWNYTFHINTGISC